MDVLLVAVSTVTVIVYWLFVLWLL